MSKFYNKYINCLLSLINSTLTKSLLCYQCNIKVSIEARLVIMSSTSAYQLSDLKKLQVRIDIKRLID